METNQEDLWYVEHRDYDNVLGHYNSAINYRYPDEESLETIMQTINSLNRNLKKNDDIILNFYKLLTNGKILLSGFNKNYCKYINFWLNKEYRKNINFNKVPDFNVFHKFVYEVNRVKIGNQNYSCAKYISNLDNKIYNNIIFLYELYDRYNKIKKPKETELNNTCSKISVLSKDYRDSIYKYYKEDKDLYNKLEHIKTLFNNITESRDSPCKDRISFIKPLDFDNHLKEEARKKAEEEEQKEAAEQEKRARDEAAARQAKEDKGRVHQNLLQSNDLSLSSSRDNQSQEMRQEYGEFHSTRYPAGSRELDTTPLQSSAQRYVYSGRPVPSTGLLLEEDHTKEDMELQGEVAYEPRGTDRTRSGISGGSSGIPGYIAEVLGSVDPGPVLGVSGGMGALFLLFKYTPVGSFFGGRRRGFRQIPSSFGGFPPDFANFQEYGGGYVGYSPMDINPLAE